MTKDEAKLYLCSIAAYLGYLSVMFDDCKAGEKMLEAIRTLEHESSINKSCAFNEVGAQDKQSMSDKLKAEISTVLENLDGCDIASLIAFVNKIDNIYDKYSKSKE